jgi:hypothetical protein
LVDVGAVQDAATGRLLQRGQVGLEDKAATVEHTDPVGDLLDLGQQMR